MKKSLSVVIMLSIVALLSGCIISISPKEDPVIVKPGETKSFMLFVFPFFAKYEWTLDRQAVSTSGMKFDYTAMAGGLVGHTLSVKATHFLGTDTYAWSIADVEDIGSVMEITPDEIVTDPDTGQKYVKGQILISAAEGATEEQVNQLVVSLGGQIIGHIKFVDVYQALFTDLLLAELESKIEQLRQNSIILSAVVNEMSECNASRVPNDPWGGGIESWEIYPWDDGILNNIPKGKNAAFESMRLPEAWAMAYKDNGKDQTLSQIPHVAVGVIDSDFPVQIDSEGAFHDLHEDLHFAWVNREGYNEFANSTDDKERLKYRHGHHVSGIIGAIADNEKGVSGVVWNADLSGYKTSLSGSDILYGIATQILVRRVNILNMSIGKDFGKNVTKKDIEDISHLNEIQKLVDRETKFYTGYFQKLKNAGVDFLVIQAAGNYNIDAILNKFAASVVDPEVKKNIIVIGSYDIKFAGGYGKDLVSIEKSDFSNYGPQVDIFAPGGNAPDDIYYLTKNVEDFFDDILALLAYMGLDIRDVIYSTIYRYEKDQQHRNYYGYMSGTSMAAPHITGLAALIKQKYPRLRMSQVKEAIVKGASRDGLIHVNDKVFEQNNWVTKANIHFYVDAFEALKKAESLSQDQQATDNRPDMPNAALIVGEFTVHDPDGNVLNALELDKYLLRVVVQRPDMCISITPFTFDPNMATYAVSLPMGANETSINARLIFSLVPKPGGDTPLYKFQDHEENVTLTSHSTQIAPFIFKTKTTLRSPQYGADISYQSVHLEWYGMELAGVQYFITINEDSEPNDIPIISNANTEGSTSFLTTLDPEKKYWWNVVAKDQNGNVVDQSEWWSFTTTDQINNPLPVNAVKYSEAATITLYMDAGSGMLLIPNGTVVPGGTKTKFGVKVEGGAYSGGRVFLSNGAGYQVEAEKEGEFYVCDYLVPSDKLLVPILVQVIYPHGYASKEKFVVRTFAGARTNQLVRDGLDVMVGKDILNSAAGMSLSGITINSLTPANAAGRYKGCVLRLEGKMGNLPVSINLAIDDGIGNIQPPGEVLPTLLLLRGGTIPLDMGITQMSLAEMIGGLAGDFGADMSGLNLDSNPLFIDVHGLPNATTDNVATLDLGLFMAVNPSKDPADPTKWLFPTGVSVYPNNNNTHPKEILTPADVDRLLGNDAAVQAKSLGVNLSMDNLSQFVSTLLDGSVNLDAASLPIPLAIPGWSGDKGPGVEQKMNISFKKEGIAFDFRKGTGPEFTLNDMRMEYLENDVPIWQMSLDMTFALDVGTHKAIVLDPITGEMVEQSFLDIYLTLIPELAHCHVMKDNLGIGLFDHSRFAIELIEALGVLLPANNAADLMTSINMSDLGFILRSASAKTDAAGRCFLKMVTDEADLKRTGICFIDTASMK